MGLLTNPLRSREPQLPTYRKVESPTKERYSDDDYTSDEDDDYYDERYVSDRSSNNSRNSSGSHASHSIMLPKRRPPPRRNARGAYPYRLPPKVTRWIAIIFVGTIALMILSLVRASQVENWKVANGKTEKRPAAPPIWEKFPFLERYYGGIRSVLPFEQSRPEYPKQQLSAALDSEVGVEGQQGGAPQSKAWGTYSSRNQEAEIQECYIDAARTIRVPDVQYYKGRPQGLPQHVIGSYEVLNLPEDVCFDRYGRYGPYGYGYSLRSGGLGIGETGESLNAEAIWESTPQVDYRNVDWADVQRRCFNANVDRYEEIPDRPVTPHGFYIGSPKSNTQKIHQETLEPRGAPTQDTTEDEAAPAAEDDQIEKKPRTAVVIRCWDEYLFREDDIANVRSMITELAMASGGRYDVHLLVQIKNDAAHPIWADQEVYERRIKEVIPEEFRGLVTLWTETQMLSIYQGLFDLYPRGPELPVHGAYRGLTMAMQYFAYMHPEYEYFWQWEMDVRYTGHYYDFFTKIENWAKEQPRKGLWERNARFYLPDVHGNWDDFSQMARVQSEMGVKSPDMMWKDIPGAQKEPEEVTKNDKTVWGPVRPFDDNDWFLPGDDPIPPTAYEQDRYVWGVGEEADYISLNPIFDPEGTTWLLKDDITGFNRSPQLPARRANIITTSRMSRKLLMMMHKMTTFKKQYAFPEMWPATVALQHGLKAVYAPHPVYVDRRWPVEYMAQMFNSGRDGSSGGSRNSIFGDREHNLHGLSWFYKSGFAPNLYRRWLGLRVNNDGGEKFETTEDVTKQGGSVSEMRGGEGRMCLPPMLLHPIKNVELPVEAPLDEEDLSVSEDVPMSEEDAMPISDPTA